jgi:single-stranded-DNA-specific exonuclease
MNGATWGISPIDLAAAQLLVEELGLSRVTAQALVRRGLTSAQSAQAFLHPDCLFHDPYQLAGVPAAAERINRALSRGEQILVCGDYDADGVCAAFLLTDVLRQLGATVRWRLPNRFREGYGLPIAAVEEAAAAGDALLITVDCGTTDVEVVRRAGELGVDVIVTDHHALGTELPPCIVVSPQLGGYPFPHLAGVGVALKLAHALLVPPGGPSRAELPLRLRPYVDVAAVGTVADVVPLLDENRALVSMGIGRLRSAPRHGLAALLEVSGTALGAVTADTVGFRLAPRINAAGRLDDPAIALRLLEAPNRAAALPHALALNDLNAARQQLEREILEEAAAMVPVPPPAAIVLYNGAWHEGVLGIVAARLAEQHHRPVILLGGDQSVVKGSGRSVPGFDLIAAVAACSQLLERFGGHAAACGVRLRRQNIGQFARRFQDYAAAHLPPDALLPRTPVDAVVAGTELTLALATELEQLAPHGQENPRVTLLLGGAQVLTSRRTKDGRHLQCRLQADGASAAAVHFNYECEALPTADGRFDVLLELSRDSFNGYERAQVKVQSLQARPGVNLCDTPCDGNCSRRLAGQPLWRLVAGQPSERAATAGGAGQAGAAVAPSASSPAGAQALVTQHVAELQAAGRLLQLGGWPVLPTVTSLLAEPGRALLLVADVARRRPLLDGGLPLPTLGRAGACVTAACARDRLPGLLAGTPAPAERARRRPPDTIIASAITAAAFPQLVAWADQLVFIDPPLDPVSFAAVLAAARGTVRFVWGDAEVHFAGAVVDSDYGIDALLRRLWRRLPQQGGPGARAAVEELFGGGSYPAKLITLQAAWCTLREAGLLAADGGKNEVVGPNGKVDLAVSPTYRLWHQRFQSAYPLRCQTAKR